MRFYIATKLENHEAHNRLRDWLCSIGHSISYDWTTHGAAFGRGLTFVEEVAEKEAQGVADADATIVLWPGGRGTHVEMGMAIGMGKTVLFYLPYEDHHAATKETCAFYHHPKVVRFAHEQTMRDWIVARFPSGWK